MDILPLQHSLLMLPPVPDTSLNLLMGPLKEPPANILFLSLSLSIVPLLLLLLILIIIIVIIPSTFFFICGQHQRWWMGRIHGDTRSCCLLQGGICALPRVPSCRPQRRSRRRHSQRLPCFSRRL